MTLTLNEDKEILESLYAVRFPISLYVYMCVFVYDTGMKGVVFVCLFVCDRCVKERERRRCGALFACGGAPPPSSHPLTYPIQSPHT